MAYTKKLLKYIKPQAQPVKIVWSDTITSNVWEADDAESPPILDAVGMLLEWKEDFIAISSLRDPMRNIVSARTVFPIGCIISVKELK